MILMVTLREDLRTLPLDVVDFFNVPVIYSHKNFVPTNLIVNAGHCFLVVNSLSASELAQCCEEYGYDDFHVDPTEDILLCVKCDMEAAGDALLALRGANADLLASHGEALGLNPLDAQFWALRVWDDLEVIWTALAHHTGPGSHVDAGPSEEIKQQEARYAARQRELEECWPGAESAPSIRDRILRILRLSK